MSAPSREPEVRVLAALATWALIGLRALIFAVGCAVIGIAIYTLFDPLILYGTPEKMPPLSQRLATNAANLCFGLPLVTPHRWTFERGRAGRVMFGIAILLVVAPMFFEANPAYCLLRILAFGVGCAPIFVWRLLWSVR